MCAGVCTMEVAGDAGAGIGTGASGAHQAFGGGCASPPASGISLPGNILIALCGTKILEECYGLSCVPFTFHILKS